MKLNSYNPPVRALPYLTMLYAIIIVTSTTLVYKIIQIGPIVMTAGALLSPIWYFLADVIAEVYGYRVSRRLIWAGLICECFFVLMCAFLIKLPSPNYWLHQQSYDIVLGNLPRVFLGSIIGTILGAFINIYLVSKWKIALKGKYFWIRSIGSNAIGQLVFSSATAFIDLLDVIPLFDIVKVIFAAYFMKVMIIPLAAIPAALLANYLKQIEGIDVYDYGIDFNPFKLFVAKNEG